MKHCRKLYGVFGPRGFTLETSAKRAITLAREHGGDVRWVPYDESVASWDAPTFRTVSRALVDKNGIPVDII
jgi:hypothetical protein